MLHPHNTFSGRERAILIFVSVGLIAVDATTWGLRLGPVIQFDENNTKRPAAPAAIFTVLEAFMIVFLIWQTRMLWLERMPIPKLWAFNLVLAAYWTIHSGLALHYRWQEWPFSVGIMGTVLVGALYSSLKCRLFVLDFRKQEEYARPKTRASLEAQRSEAGDEVPGMVPLGPVRAFRDGERPARDDDSIITPPPIYDGTFDPPGYSRYQRGSVGG
ncbi:Hypothetical protein D9617_18g034560 [Elsinoe fawcettii]|nr:Hypothetical protein D9617_18g034560 [Elsinoe fawcettii]